MGTRAASWTMVAAAVLLTAGSAAAQAVQTIRPGMTTDEVKSTFGEPATTRTYGDYTYYFYQNGVEREYGTADIVFFLDGQVVDAVLRSDLRSYAGESSSPRGTEPRPTPGGMRLEIPGEVQAVEVRTAPAPLPQAAFEEAEPMIEEPVAEEPMAEEPMAEEPMAEEPMAEEPVAEQAVEEPIEETPPPAPVAEAEAEMLPLEALAQEFQDFVPVCIQTFVDNDIFQVHEARPLCECTARESAAVGVDPATIARIAEALRADPSALSQDPQVQQAGSTCVERVMEESSARRGGS